MFYTYVLISNSDSNFYIGFTKNLKRRFQEHNNGAVASTTNRRPFELIYYEACLTEADALKREKYFKTGFGRRFLRNRLETYFKTALAL
jgi:putative endonuclease